TFRFFWRPGIRCPVLRARESGRGDIECLLAFRTLSDFEFDFLPFFESLEAVHLYGREVSKKVFAPIIGSDEAKPFGIVEPFNGSRQLLSIPGHGGYG